MTNQIDPEYFDPDQQGFSFSYKVNDYIITQKFGDRSCGEVIEKFIAFMLGCGFTARTLAVCLADAADELSNSEGSILAEILSAVPPSDR